MFSLTDIDFSNCSSSCESSPCPVRHLPPANRTEHMQISPQPTRSDAAGTSMPLNGPEYVQLLSMHKNYKLINVANCGVENVKWGHVTWFVRAPNLSF